MLTQRRGLDLQLSISPDGHWFRDGQNRPFFWLGDTAWLGLIRLDLDEIDRYLQHRADQGFTVIQVMLVHRWNQATVEGYRAMPDGFFDGRMSDDRFWCKLDQVLERAAERGLVMALVPVWGSNVLEGHLNETDARSYGQFLGRRYAVVPNIVWLNGGDIRGEQHPEIWQALGQAIKDTDPVHLMTYHPFGRTDSSWWFHNAGWLDFNMFQSGHRRYGQRDAEGDYRLSDGLEEDNWRYVREDFSRTPARPVLDGEPSYEAIPQGLWDLNQPLWQAHDCRRYAWWSVLAGAAGHTYGHNAVMQMHDPRHPAAYGCATPWALALDAPGGVQMKAVRILMEAFDDESRRGLFFGDKPRYYDHLAALEGDGFLLAYSYQGSQLILPFWTKPLPPLAAWYDPRQGVFSKQPVRLVRSDHTWSVTKPDAGDHVLVMCGPVHRQTCIDRGIGGAISLHAV